jgi:hypothetical protein
VEPREGDGADREKPDEPHTHHRNVIPAVVAGILPPHDDVDEHCHGVHLGEEAVEEEEEEELVVFEADAVVHPGETQRVRLVRGEGRGVST